MLSFKETFFTFCNRTSLHGWQFFSTYNNKSSQHNYCRNLYWFFVMVVSLTFGIGAMMFHVYEYNNATPITSLDNVTIPLSEIYFPSVSVCNINQVRQSYFEDLGQDVNHDFINHIYHKYIEGKTMITSVFQKNTKEELEILEKLDEKL